mmetsp:Transcript_111929/g.316315  ORF Transcript_111929/g.316315 Transcript_111929/m.316315 type:complete len:281 (+) Transcript_111929:96-938(+)
MSLEHPARPAHGRRVAAVAGLRPRSGRGPCATQQRHNDPEDRLWYCQHAQRPLRRGARCVAARLQARRHGERPAPRIPAGRGWACHRRERTPPQRGVHRVQSGSVGTGLRVDIGRRCAQLEGSPNRLPRCFPDPPAAVPRRPGLRRHMARHVACDGVPLRPRCAPSHRRVQFRWGLVGGAVGLRAHPPRRRAEQTRSARAGLGGHRAVQGAGRFLPVLLDLGPAVGRAPTWNEQPCVGASVCEVHRGEACDGSCAGRPPLGSAERAWCLAEKLAPRADRL